MNDETNRTQVVLMPSIHQHYGVKVWDAWNGQPHDKEQDVCLYWKSDTLPGWYFLVGTVAVPLTDHEMLSLRQAIGWILPS